MKLASLKNGERDGQLVVVSRDLLKVFAVPEIAPTLQHLLDHWSKLVPAVAEVYHRLNAGQCERAEDFDPHQCESPLPRAYQWADASAFVNHVELVRKSRGVEMPESFWTDPLMYQGGSDKFIGPYDDITVSSIDYGVDMEAEIAVVLDEVAMAASPEKAAEAIRLLMLVNDVSLRNLIPAEIAKGFGFFQGKPSSAFSPVAVTPDELGDAWDGDKLHLPLETWHNDQLIGRPNCGVDMTFGFARLIAHAAKTRPLGAGTIIGSGTVSNKDRSTGSSCLAELRMLEILESGKPHTQFMQFGDRVRIEMFDKQEKSIFGRIEQIVKPYKH